MITDITLPTGCLDPDRIAATFAAYGVVIMPGLFSDAETAACRAAVQAWAATPAAQDPFVSSPDFSRHQTRVIPWLPIQEGQTSFMQLRDHPRMAAATAAAIGCGAVGDGCLVMLSRTGHVAAWHQDTDCADPGQFMVNRLLYPWDVDPRSGSLVCVPGSHRAGKIPPGDPHGPLAGEVALAPQAGTLILVHSLCYHRVTSNTTEHERVSINFRIRPASARQDLDRYGVYRTGTYDFVAKANKNVS